MTTRLRCGLIQSDIAWRDPDANRNQFEQHMDSIPGCDLLILPEACMHGFLAGLDTVESMHGESVNWLLRQARVRNATILAGLLISEDERILNRMVVVNPDGRVEYYDKRHLFAPGGESEQAGYSAGVQRVRIRLSGWRIDLQICYDLRFPVWCRNHSSRLNRYDLQVFIANWPAERIDAWLALLKARAIENQAYVIGVNRVGQDANSIRYPGRSAAFDASGRCLIEMGTGSEVSVVELDLRALHDLREHLPFLADKDSFELA